MLRTVIMVSIGAIIAVVLLIWRICWTTKRDCDVTIGGRGKK